MDKDDFIIGDDIQKYQSIDNCRLTRKQDRFQEPFIFFGKQINETSSAHKPFNPPQLIHYKYVAFNDGKIFGKKAKFNELFIDTNWNYKKEICERSYFIADISIEKIPKDDLNELKEFIKIKRDINNDISFCKTIYNAVIQELDLRKNNTNIVFFRQINQNEDKEKKIRSIQPDKQYEYRQLLVSINEIKQKLNAPASYHGHSGWTQGYNQNAYNKRTYHEQLSKLLNEKKNIENKYSLSNN